MNKARKKLVINYILLFLIVVLVIRLVFAVEWIANQVPDGIIGLLMVLGYFLFILFLFLVLINKVANELITTEQEIKQQKLKSPTNNFHLFKKK